MKIFCLVLITFSLASCISKDEYPEIPILEFKSLQFAEIYGKDTALGQFFILKVTFTDGDGDIGYSEDRPYDSIFDDEESEYFYNFRISLQVFKNGIWEDDTAFNISGFRIPYVTPDGSNKTLKGELEGHNELPLPFNDTLRFKAWIYDRSLHKSNEVVTPGYFVVNN